MYSNAVVPFLYTLYNQLNWSVVSVSFSLLQGPCCRLLRRLRQQGVVAGAATGAGGGEEQAGPGGLVAGAELPPTGPVRAVVHTSGPPTSRRTRRTTATVGQKKRRIIQSLRLRLTDLILMGRPMTKNFFKRWRISTMWISTWKKSLVRWKILKKLLEDRGDLLGCTCHMKKTTCHRAQEERKEDET